MKTKYILGFALAVGAGFLLTRTDLFSKIRTHKLFIKASQAASDIKVAASDVAKKAACEIKWQEANKTKRYASNEAYQEAHDNFMNSCMQT